MFPNERKQSDKHPDFTGQGLVAGVEMWVSMWVKRSSKTGEEFFSISVRPKDEARREGAQRQEASRVNQAYAEEEPRQQRQVPAQRGPSNFSSRKPSYQPAPENECPAEFGDDWEREP